MKKLASMILAVVTALTLVCSAAFAESVPQPEGGKKFESNWALFVADVTVQIVYEDEGYKVEILNWDPAELKGTEWEYSCLYNEEKDALESVSSKKVTYTKDPETFDDTYAPAEYEGLDDEKTATYFTISEKGKLLWADGRGQDGIDLEFTNIGNFSGVWRSADGKTWAEIEWDGSDEKNEYLVFVHDGDDDYYTEHTMHGLYNTETRKLETTGTVTIVRKNAEGTYDSENSDEPTELIFSDLGDGKILLEAENGIELIRDMSAE